MQPLIFTCPQLTRGGKFPIEHTGRGQNISPAFDLANLSPQAQTLAITLEDLTHPIEGFTHWVIWNIPAAAHIDAAIPAGKAVPALGQAVQGIGYGLHRYAGPKPPQGKTHQYRFTLYALDCALALGAHAGKRQFLRRAQQHIVQMGSLLGEFE